MAEVDDLRKASLLLGVDDDCAAAIITALSPQLVRFNAAEDICHPNKPETCIWVLISGLVIVKEYADGNLRAITTRSSGAIIGELGFFGVPEENRTAVVSVATPTSAWAIRYENIRRLDPEPRSELIRELGTIVSLKLAETTLQTAGLTARSAADLELLRMFVPQSGLSYNDRLRLLEGTGIKADYQQRSAVILFSDIVGFSEIASQISPQETATLVRSFLDPQVRAIEDAEGEIDKFVGDAVMAWWLCDNGNEEQLRQACLKALAAADRAVTEVQSIPNPVAPATSLRVRVGLHVGQAHVGNYGSESRSSFTVIGDDVNIAARLEQARDAASGGVPLGPIRVSERFASYLPPERLSLLPHKTNIRVKSTDVEMRYSDFS